jgi:DtxR family Mn-dependent transcriptional regulator
MADHGLLQVDGNAFELTARGRDSALHILRAHRLWERYLAEETGYVEAEWHDRAERHEHHISTDDADNLSVHLGNPTHDPHGDPIPTAGGALVYHEGSPLSNQASGERLRVVHLEDEPEAVYAQLVALGLHPGMEVQLLESGPTRIRLWAAGDEHVIAPVLAANISVLPVIAPERADADEGELLADLRHGQSGRVLGISPKCRGLERRRLLDLGVLPGTVITAEMRSPSGDPTAYRIRDAVIGLRAEQAGMINVAPI